VINNFAMHTIHAGESTKRNYLLHNTEIMMPITRALDYSHRSGSCYGWGLFFWDENFACSIPGTPV